MKKEQSIRILSIIIIILVISQAASIYLIITNTSQLFLELNQTNQQLNEKIDKANQDTQSKINSLTSAITTLSSSQSDIQQQLGEIKASTSSDFSGIIEQAVKGVVTIKTNVAQGSGFIITSDGYLVTNAHVLSGARYANAYTFDGTRFSADLIGYDTNIDIALLKISGSFDELSFGDSDSVKIGEKVIAIGNPLGLSFTSTEGIISAQDRRGDNNLPYYFQTDVSLNPGNSGGPLINNKGKVIGINNFKISTAENIGFALESNPAIETINTLSEKALNQTLV